MFPNFKSLKDKQYNRKKLLEQIERDQELELIKNEAYTLADWASDQSKTISVNAPSINTAAPKSTLSTQTDNNITSGSTQTDSNTSSFSTQTDNNTTSFSTQTDNNASSIQTQTNPNTNTISTQTALSGDVKSRLGRTRIKTEPGFEEEQQKAKDEIEYIYGRIPKLVGKKLNPLKSNGIPDRDVYIGSNGQFLNVKTNKPTRKASYQFDYSQTLNHIQHLEDKIQIKEEPMEHSPMDVEMTSLKDRGTTLTDGAIESDAKELLYRIINNKKNHIDPSIHIEPIGKIINPKTKKIWNYSKNHYINKDLDVIYIPTGQKNNVLDISWVNTLEHFLSKIEAQGIRLQESKTIKQITKKWDSPLTIEDLNATLDNSNHKATQFDGKKQFKDTIIELYNNNDWLIDYKLHPVSSKRADGTKQYPDKSYILGEYAQLIHVKKNGNQKAIEGKSLSRIDKLTDWEATYDLIIRDYNDYKFGENVLYEPHKVLYPRGLNDEEISQFQQRFGRGFSKGLNPGRRSILNNERYKLSGELLLGNHHQKIRKELQLLNRYEKK